MFETYWRSLFRDVGDFIVDVVAGYDGDAVPGFDARFGVGIAVDQLDVFGLVGIDAVNLGARAAEEIGRARLAAHLGQHVVNHGYGRFVRFVDIDDCGDSALGVENLIAEVAAIGDGIAKNAFVFGAVQDVFRAVIGEVDLEQAPGIKLVGIVEADICLVVKAAGQDEPALVRAARVIEIGPDASLVLPGCGCALSKFLSTICFSVVMPA